MAGKNSKYILPTGTCQAGILRDIRVELYTPQHGEYMQWESPDLRDILYLEKKFVVYIRIAY